MEIIYRFNPQVQGHDYYPGQLKRGPDSKIYLAGYSYGHPYSDTCCYDTLTMYLSVINSPDSAGLACNFTPFSFYLGGNRTYSCLPDIPNYQIGPAIGSGKRGGIGDDSARVCRALWPVAGWQRVCGAG